MYAPHSSGLQDALIDSWRSPSEPGPDLSGSCGMRSRLAGEPIRESWWMNPLLSGTEPKPQRGMCSHNTPCQAAVTWTGLLIDHETRISFICAGNAPDEAVAFEIRYRSGLFLFQFQVRQVREQSWSWSERSKNGTTHFTGLQQLHPDSIHLWFEKTPGQNQSQQQQPSVTGWLSTHQNVGGSIPGSREVCRQERTWNTGR